MNIRKLVTLADQHRENEKKTKAAHSNFTVVLFCLHAHFFKFSSALI